MVLIKQTAEVVLTKGNEIKESRFIIINNDGSKVKWLPKFSAAEIYEFGTDYWTVTLSRKKDAMPPKP